MLDFDHKSFFFAVCFMVAISLVAPELSGTGSLDDSQPQPQPQPQFRPQAQFQPQPQAQAQEPQSMPQDGEVDSSFSESHSEAKIVDTGMYPQSNGSTIVKTEEITCVDGNCTRKSSEQVIPPEEDSAAEDRGEGPVIQPLLRLPA